MNKLLPSIIAAASILILFFLVLPTFDQSRMLRGSIKEREDILKESQEISNRINNLNQEIEDQGANIDKLDKLLPGQKEIPELLANVESLVAASGMILSEMNLSETASLENVRKINGTLKLSGSFTSFMNFLDLLEKNLRLIDIETVDAAAQLVEGSRSISYDVRFEVNYLAE